MIKKFPPRLLSQKLFEILFASSEHQRVDASKIMQFLVACLCARGGCEGGIGKGVFSSSKEPVTDFLIVKIARVPTRSNNIYFQLSTCHMIVPLYFLFDESYLMFDLFEVFWCELVLKCSQPLFPVDILSQSHPIIFMCARC